MIPDPLGAVIFDMDGLLLDSETLQRAACIESCAQFDFEMTDEMFHDLIGRPIEVINQLLFSYFGPHFPLDAFNERRRTIFESLCEPAIALKLGAAELLEHLDRLGIPCAVATSTGRAKAAFQLKRAGISDRFDAVVTRDDVARGKPFPDSFLKAAELLGVPPSQCLALEDSYQGVRAAHAAGMATIMVPDLLAPRPEVTALCVAVMESLEHVRSALRAF